MADGVSGCGKIIYDTFTGSRICEETGEVLEEAVISDNAGDNITYSDVEASLGGFHGIGYAATPYSDHRGGIHLGQRALQYGHFKAASANVISNSTVTKRVVIAKRLLTETFIAGRNLAGPLTVPAEEISKAESLYYPCLANLWELPLMRRNWYLYAPAIATAAVFVSLNGSVDPTELYEFAVSTAKSLGINGEIPGLFVSLKRVFSLADKYGLNNCTSLVKKYTRMRIESVPRVIISKASRAALEVEADQKELTRAASDLIKRLEADKAIAYNLATRKAIALLALSLAVAANADKPWGSRLVRIFNPKAKAENSYAPHNMARSVYQRHNIMIAVSLGAPSAKPRIDPRIFTAIHYTCPRCGADLTEHIAIALWGKERQGKGFKYTPLVPAKKAAEALDGHCPICMAPLEPRGYVIPIRLANGAAYNAGSSATSQERDEQEVQPNGEASS